MSNSPLDLPVSSAGSTTPKMHATEIVDAIKGSLSRMSAV